MDFSNDLFRRLAQHVVSGSLLFLPGSSLFAVVVPRGARLGRNGRAFAMRMVRRIVWGAKATELVGHGGHNV